ncbi:MAG: amino acid permease [Deltaproteobacteria bacterium]|nr:amino acid permease [Deltaproteobacteria bacterium]MBN2674268.1 amino acid permease [Deltaproteobacteria bacterium]
MKTLDRSLGLFSVIGISVGAMLGSGIFVLPGLAAAKTGHSVWIAYVIAGLCALPAAFSKSELATAMPTSGGTYIYIDRTFGPYAGTIAGMGLWISLLLKSAFALVGFGAYLSVFADIPLKLIAIVALAAIVTLNIMGVKKVGKIQIFVIIIALGSLSVLVLMGAPMVNWPVFQSNDQFTDGFTGLFATAAFVFVSYAGVTKAAAVAEEVYKPEKNLPLGILFSLIMVTIVYALVVLVMAGTIPMGTFIKSDKPVYDLAFHIGGRVLGLAGALLGVITMTSMANAGILASSRFPFAMSRDALVPPQLSHVHSKYGTPIVSVVATGVMMAAAIVLLPVEKLAKLASAFVIMLFVVENFTVIVLRESSVQWYKPAYKSPLYPIMQVLGILSGLGLLVVMGLDALIGLVSIIIPGIFLYIFYGRKRTKRKGEFTKMSARTDLAQAQYGDDHEPSSAEIKPSSVLVSLFGNERSPETIVEMGIALSKNGRVVVQDITEIQDSHMETAALKTDPRQRALARRFAAMAEDKKVDIDFRALASHDSAKTVHVASDEFQADCLLLAWGGRATLGRLFRNPYAWLASHVRCNLGFFKDAGVRYIRKILVFAEPGPHDVLVVATADHLAKLFRAKITFVRFVESDVSEPIFQSQTNYVNELRHLCQSETTVRMIRGKNLYSAITKETVHHDLLVLGAPPDSGIKRLLLTNKEDAITEQAACSVLRLRTPKTKIHAEFKKVEGAEKQASLRDWLIPECVETHIKVKKKEELFSHIAKSFAAHLPGVTAQQVDKALWERENTQNTSVGRGLALPHATIEESGGTKLAVFTTKDPIDYHTATGEKLDVFIVTVGPSSERHKHLELLAGVAQIVLETDLIAELRTCEQSPQAVQIIESNLKATEK